MRLKISQSEYYIIFTRNIQYSWEKSKRNPKKIQVIHSRNSPGPGPLSTRYLKQTKKLYETSVLKLKKIFKTKSRPSNFVQISLKILLKCPKVKSDEEYRLHFLPSSSTIYLASPVRFYHLEYNLLCSNISGRNDICHSARAPSVLTGLAPFRGQSSSWKLDWKLDKRVVEPCRSCIDWPQSPM